MHVYVCWQRKVNQLLIILSLHLQKCYNAVQFDNLRITQINKVLPTNEILPPEAMLDLIYNSQ